MKRFRQFMFVQDVEHMNFKFEELPNILKSESSRLSEWAYIKHNHDEKAKSDKEDTKVRDHIHVVLKYRNPQTVAHVAKLFKDKSNNVQIWIGRINNAYSYLVHNTDNATSKYQYSIEDVKASFDFKKRIKDIEENVSLAKQRNIKEAINGFAEGDIDYKELIETLGIVNVAKNRNLIDSIQKIREQVIQHEWWNQFNGKQMASLWLWGEAGVGKTTYAERILSNEKYIVLGNSNDYFQYYNGEHYIILNDLRPGDLKYADLLRILDPYAIKYTFGRYHNHPLLAEMIIITTPYSPREFYKNTRIANRKIDSLTQLQRRIFEIHITKDFILKENKYQRNSKERSSD